VSGVPVSVVMPLFNKQRQVSGSVHSVLGQTCGDFELIIVDDGSTDRSREVVASIEDRRIRVIDQKNSGVSSARNRGIAAAGADLIAFCDADDEWEPRHLEALLGLAARFPEASVFATGYVIAERGGRPRTNILRGLSGGFEEGYLENYFRVAAGSDPPLHTSSVAATRQALHAVGLFPVGVHTGEDLLTWARLAERCRIAYQRRPSAIFRAPGRVTDRPGRTPAEPDVVGGELARMLARTPEGTAGDLAAYLALWHRMRGVVYLKLGNRRRARTEFGRALRRGGWSFKAGSLWLLGLLPRAGSVFERLEQRRNWLREVCR